MNLTEEGDKEDLLHYKKTLYKHHSIKKQESVALKCWKAEN